MSSNPIEAWANYITANLGDPWDWTSFGVGVGVGMTVVIAAGAVVLYFAWPQLVDLLGTIFGPETVGQVVSKMLKEAMSE